MLKICMIQLKFAFYYANSILVAHSKYLDIILPNGPLDFTFQETIEKLNNLFSIHKSLFNLRNICFNTFKKDDMDIISHQGIVHKNCEQSQTATMSINQCQLSHFSYGFC